MKTNSYFMYTFMLNKLDYILSSCLIFEIKSAFLDLILIGHSKEIHMRNNAIAIQIISFLFVFRLAAAQEAAAQQRSGRDCSPAPGHVMAPHPQQPPAGAKGPTSLFFLSEDNPIRRYTRFIIEWPYPFKQKMF